MKFSPFSGEVTGITGGRQWILGKQPITSNLTSIAINENNNKI